MSGSLRSLGRQLICLALALASLTTASDASHASEIVFSKVLGTDDRIPGEAATFGSLHVDGSDPARRRVYAQAHVAMDAAGNIAFGARRRLFAIVDGQLESVTPDPMSGDLGQIHIEDGDVTWSMDDLGGTREGGIFRWEEGTTREIAGRHTPVPEGGGCVFWTKLDDGITSRPFGVGVDAVVFSGTVDDEDLPPEVAPLGPPTRRCASGSFLWRNGTLHRVGDLWPSPRYTLRASIEGSLIAFDGYDGTLYRQRLGKAPRRLIGPGDPIPGGRGIFARVGGATVASGRIAFWGSDEAGRKGVYLWDGGFLSPLIEEGTELGGGRALERLDQLRLGSDRVAVQGADSEGWFTYVAPLEGGSYRVAPHAAGLGEFNGSQILMGNEWAPLSVIRSDGSLLHVLAPGEWLDGQRVAFLHPGELRGNSLVFAVTFEPFEPPVRQAIYVAKLPPIPVDITIRPGRSRRVTRVAILGSGWFDVRAVDTATLGFGPGGATIRTRARIRDMNRDGSEDLLVHFRTPDAGITQQREACLSGQTLDGIEFEGCQTIPTVPAKAS